MFNLKAQNMFVRFVVSAAIAGLFVLTAFAQDDDIRIDTDLVTFEVSVEDKNGNPVRGLTQSDFDLLVNGHSRELAFFKPITKNNVDRPLSVVFALDISGSITKEELGRLQIAMQTFVDRLADYNSYFAVMTFGMKVKTVQSFTNRPGKLKKTFRKILKADDGLSTHAYDAVDGAIRLIRKKSPKVLNKQIPKRVVIVITDGYPVGDTVSPSTVIERANAQEISVFGVIFPSYSRLSRTGRPVLTLFEASGVVSKTGGSVLYATEKDFEPLFKALAEQITASYALAFYPTEREKDGVPRLVKVKTREGFVITQNKTAFRLKKQN
jgi:VWFA-related protein